ncbi:MAG: TonB-dependent receptor, partial [Candidatus Omnitrophica bacterium]|nr:TonB-dependent receptor [Candidatus Omnitrophota bacterium]
FRNIHTTHIKGVKIPVDFESFDCKFNIFTEMRQETVDSTNLSFQDRNLFSIGASVSNELFRNFNFFLSLRVDDYSIFNTEVSPGAVLTYSFNEDETVFSSFQRAYRVPSFTELYYDSPANTGNSKLSAEESLSWELGYVKKGEYSYGASVFRRLDYDLIDWVKNSISESWSAKNMPRSETGGFEYWAYRNGFKLSYSFLDSCYSSDFLYSKYSANYLRHSLSCVKSLEFRLLNLVLNLSYKNRSGGDEFINLDLELNRSMKFQNHAANLYLKVFNATNVKQYDVEGVVLPGRWITSGLSLEF